jgi:GNAT superfamily N-acetyltransferase
VYGISRASVADAERGAELVRLVVPVSVVTPASIRYRLQLDHPDDHVGYWKAELDGALVGWALGGLDAFAADPTDAFAAVIVHPAHRRRGVGTQLWGAVSEHLRGAGAIRVVCSSDADEGSEAFARGHGAVFEASHATLVLDPTTLPPPPEPPSGVDVLPLARFEAVPELVYSADHESAQDEPGPNDLSGMDFESWRRLVWDNPDCDHELSVAAVVDGSVVATSFLYSDREAGRAMNAGTGVVRAHRGRGLGLLMKRHSLAAAAAAGITRVVTQNDESNAPMLAINEALGYRPFATGSAWTIRLAP